MWGRTCEAAGYWWPPTNPLDPLPAAADLVHQVGLHYYHAWDTTPGGVEYFGEWLLATELGYLQGVCDALKGSFPSLGLSMTVTGFAAYGHSSTEVVLGGRAEAEPHYADADVTLQAEIYLRRMLACLASGVQAAMIWTWMAGPATADGGGLSFMGVRNDILPSGAAALHAWRDAWPRASWFALRRLIELVGASASVGWLDAAPASVDDLCAVELVAAGAGYRYDGADWPYAYVFWLDQKAAVSSVTWHTYLWTTTFSYALARLVPAGGDAGVPGGFGGYAASSGVDWAWAPLGAGGYGGLTVAATQEFLHLARVVVTVPRAAEPGVLGLGSSRGLALLFTSNRL